MFPSNVDMQGFYLNNTLLVIFFLDTHTHTHTHTHTEKQENRKQLNLFIMGAKGETDGMDVREQETSKGLHSRLCTCSDHRPTAWRGPGLGYFKCVHTV